MCVSFKKKEFKLFIRLDLQKIIIFSEVLNKMKIANLNELMSYVTITACKESIVFFNSFVLKMLIKFFVRVSSNLSKSTVNVTTIIYFDKEYRYMITSINIIK